MNEGFTERFFSAEDGLQLHARVYGPWVAQAVPVVCLPGLTRNVRDFHELAVILSTDAEYPRKVVAFDYRGRGRSAHDPDWRNYDVMVEARDVMAGLTALGVGHGVFLGTSRGALIIMLLAALRPAAISAAILNDAGPVVDGAGLARIRSQMERMPKPADWDDALRIQRAGLGHFFPALADEDWQRYVRAIYRDESGKPVLDYDPKLLKTVMGIDFSQPLPVLWPQFHGLARVPVMVIRGSNSDLLSASTVEEMAARHPDLEAIEVEGQGHAPLLETGELPARIKTFLQRVDRRLARP